MSIEGEVARLAARECMETDKNQPLPLKRNCEVARALAILLFIRYLGHISWDSGMNDISTLSREFHHEAAAPAERLWALSARAGSNPELFQIYKDSPTVTAEQC